MSLASFDQALGNQQLLAAQKAILIGLSEGFLNPFFVRLRTVNGETERYLSGFVIFQKSLLDLVEEMADRMDVFV